MHIVRFIFPFLFMRNWHDGSWELSRARLTLFGMFLALLIIGFGIVYVLQAPVEFSRTS